MSRLGIIFVNFNKLIVKSNYLVQSLLQRLSVEVLHDPLQNWRVIIKLLRMDVSSGLLLDKVVVERGQSLRLFATFRQPR